jgi:threonine dehydrogenase-like Zn-dependent dehydrogenase
MNAIVNTAPGRLEWLEVPTPEPGPGQVRIRTAAVGICATDLEMIAGWDRTKCPSIPGHEWAGRVDAAGEGVDESLIGKPCVAENVLSDGGEVGFEHPGAYGECFLTEAANVHILPDDMDLGEAALIEPLAVCVRGLHRLRLEDRDSAVVLGDGTIGLLMLALLRAEGVQRVYLVGGRPARLAVGREMGAHETLNYHEVGESLGEAITRLAGGPVGIVAEASGSSAAMEAALGATRPKGKVLILGDYGEGRADFRWNLLLHHELELIGTNASAGAWGDAVARAISGKLSLGRLISRRLPAQSFDEAVELARTSRDTIKVVMEWTRET